MPVYGAKLRTPIHTRIFCKIQLVNLRFYFTNIGMVGDS